MRILTEENNFSEWSGAGFGSLSDTSDSPSVGFGEAPQPVESPAETPAREELAGLQLPKFINKQTEDAEDHVEVTYAASETPALPEDALMFDAPGESTEDDVPVFELDDEVVDLTSLGAVEYKE